MAIIVWWIRWKIVYLCSERTIIVIHFINNLLLKVILKILIKAQYLSDEMETKLESYVPKISAQDVLVWEYRKKKGSS